MSFATVTAHGDLRSRRNADPTEKNSPNAAIGVIATIALGIFGRMAKRWKDMNA
jgi:hypothetical protein